MTAAERGHSVTVFGQEAGGKAQLQSRLRVSESLSSIADYQVMRLQDLGVPMRLGAPARIEDIRALQPDAVVLATGADLSGLWTEAPVLPVRGQASWVEGEGAAPLRGAAFRVSLEPGGPAEPG